MTRTTEKYAPKKLGDLKGNPKAHGQLRNILSDPRGRALLSGQPGIGKTSAVYAVATELGMKVIEVNASDERTKDQLRDILLRCQMYSIGGAGMIYLLDEVEGADFRAWATVEEILTYSRHPVVMTANESWKIPKKVKQLCVEIKLRQPYIKSVVNVAKDVAEKEGMSLGSYRNIKKRDIRNATNIVIYGGESYEEVTPFSIVTDFFTKGDIRNVNMKDAAWLFDNAPMFLYGGDLYEFYEILEVASRSDVGVLSCVAKGRGDYPRFPKYYRRGGANNSTH